MLEKTICWPLNGGKNHINDTLATAKGGGRGRLIEVAVK